MRKGACMPKPSVFTPYSDQNYTTKKGKIPQRNKPQGTCPLCSQQTGLVLYQTQARMQRARCFVEFVHKYHYKTIYTCIRMSVLLKNSWYFQFCFRSSIFKHSSSSYLEIYLCFLQQWNFRLKTS
ncbi:unnamed protein product [Orchesella dallaii]|uniref:LITAF domain-containing protein n=1 Tax=Orchesella dallaii TaxID=48710 RepID=A0ABP1RQN5_9HEXA